MTEMEGAADSGATLQPTDLSTVPGVETKGLPWEPQLGFPNMPHIQQVQQVQVWQGQFPPPEAIERYVAVQPDAFDRIIRMAERGQEATIQQSKVAMAFQAADVRRGHVLGTAITFTAILGAVGAAYLGQVMVALALVGVPVISVAKALIDSVTVSKQVSGQLKEIDHFEPSDPNVKSESD
jgi:uncharacterized membrane protein